MAPAMIAITAGGFEGFRKAGIFENTCCADTTVATITANKAVACELSSLEPFAILLYELHQLLMITIDKKISVSC